MLQIPNLHLLSGMVTATCKSLVFPFAGRKWRKQRARLRQSQPRLGRDQANCFCSQISRWLPKERRTKWARRDSIVQWAKKPGNVEFCALPQAWKSLHAPDAAQPLREAKCRYWDTEYQRHPLNFVPDNETLLPIQNLLDFFCVSGSCV